LAEVRRLLDDERPWMVTTLTGRWGDRVVVARGEMIDVADLQALVALDGEEPVGLLGYRVDRESLEVVTLDAFAPGAGVGSALLAAAIDLARGANLRRLWLVTTNDNIDAIAFCMKRGLSLACVHLNAVTWAREVKPAIPDFGNYGLPVEDEVELELLFDAVGPPPLNRSS
jgi:GNAT superfamily N-acetyltransferase